MTDLLRTDQAAFSTLFRKSAVKRAKHAGMVRNAIIMTRSDDVSSTGVQDDPGVADAVRWAKG